MSTNSILSGIAKDCANMGASIGANKDLILINYFDFNKPLTLSALNRQINDDFNNKGGLTDIKLFEGATQYVFEGTDYSVVPSVSTETKEDGNTWYSHSIAFTVYNKTAEARNTLLSLGKARVIAVTRDRSTGLYELFGAEQGLKLSGLDRPYTGSQASNFYSITIATPDIAVIKERSIGELSLKLDGVSGTGGVVPPNDSLEYLLSLKEDKINKGVPNGYAPLDGSGKVPAGHLNIINDLITGGATNLLSAQQGVILSNRLGTGLNNIKTERIIVLEAPITRLKASEAINNLPSFFVEPEEIPYFVTTTTEGEQGYKVELFGLGTGFYGQGGTAISAFNVRMSTLVDSGLAGINEILFLGNTARDKTLFFKPDSVEDVYTSISTGFLNIVNGVNTSQLTEDILQFGGVFGLSSILPPTRTDSQTTANNLPNKSGTLAVSINGIFADEDGNILLSNGGGIPTWQQTLNVANADVLVPFMKVSNNTNESYFGLNDTANDVAFQVVTPKRILLDALTSGKIELGNGLGILIDGLSNGVDIKANSTVGLTLEAGGTGGVSIIPNEGVLIDARDQSVTVNGRNGGILLDSGAGLTISGNNMLVNSVSQFNAKALFKNTTGLTINTNIGNFEASLKSDLITKSGLVFQLPNPASGTYTLATTADVIAPNLNTVLATGSIGTDKTITLNSVTDTTTVFTNDFNGLILTNTVSGVIKKSTLSKDGFVYENSSNNRKQTIDSLGLKSENSSLNTFSQITPEGLFLQQNPSTSTYSINLRGTYVSGTSKILELPNTNGTLMASVNGITPDSNGNVILSIAGTQNLTQVLTQGNSAGGLNIQGVNDLNAVTLTLDNSTASTVLKQKVGSTISGNLILPEKTGDNIIPLSVNNLLPNDAGLITLPITNFADGENLPVTVTPPTSHYTPIGSTLKGHLQGIDQALGAVVQTTAGITNRIYFTGVTTTISAGTFYTSSVLGKGAVASVQQDVTNADNQKQYFAQDLVSVAQTVLTTAPAGTFTGQLTVQISATLAQQRYTIEVYKTDVNGTPIASGITGAPTGDLGVTVVAILDSGLISLVGGSLTNISLSGRLESLLTLNVNERLRYHVSGEKVGTDGGNLVMSAFYGSNYNSFYDVPVTPTTDTVLNRSAVTGVNSSDAFNTLNTGKSDKASPTFTGVVTSPALILSSETASTLASFDASKNIKSLDLATYPSLTEISYIKGVTSAVQTQLNNKQVKDSQITVSGNTTIDVSWDGQTILFTGSGTITVPNTLPNEFSFNAITMASVTINWAITSPFVWLFGTPSAVLEKTYLNFTRVGSTNNIIIGM